jgi:hypothetical protein
MSADTGVLSPVPRLPNFIAVQYAVFTDPVLSHAAKLLFSRLEFYAGKDGKAYPKHNTLGSEMGLSTRQVRTVLTELKDQNRIDWKRTRTSCIFEIKPAEEWKFTSALDRKKTSTLIGRKLPLKSGRKLPIEKKYRRSSSKRSSEKKPGAVLQGSTASATSKENPKPKTDSLRSDDEKTKTASEREVYAHPEDELRAIHREKTGDELSPDVERRIWELVEIRGVPRKQFMDELRKHVPNTWKNPAGFLTNFARRIGSVSTPELVAPLEPEPPKNGNGRCSACNGIGYAHWDADPVARVYCDCRMGRELKRVDTHPPAAAVTSEAVA